MIRGTATAKPLRNLWVAGDEIGGCVAPGGDAGFAVAGQEARTVDR